VNGVAVVGAGHGGVAIAGMLRQRGYRERIDLYTAETNHPYHRPPLSKKFAQDPLPQWLRPQAFYAEQGIGLRLGERVTSIDPGTGAIETGGPAGRYEHIVLATGARPRRLPLPGAELAGVLHLRTMDDALALRAQVGAGQRLVVIGGGYVGLEVAIAAREQLTEVVVLEREPRVLNRVASKQLSEFVTGFHRAQGVVIREKADVAEVVGHDGTTVPCDAVLIGVGAVPREELAVAAGLRCDAGIVVDGAARTSAARILAVGDATRRPVGRRGEMLRLESIPSANEQASQAAATILGEPARAEHEVPWFWSDQADVKIKIAGVLSGDVVSSVVRGNAEARRFSVFHLNDADTVVAVESVSAPADFIAGQSLIARRTRVDPTRLADQRTSLRDVVPAA
jgi:3-phenylpropionate/trans-cinnamate dioxygenase ferredoxin reductase component